MLSWSDLLCNSVWFLHIESRKCISRWFGKCSRLCMTSFIKDDLLAGNLY